jgi:hypothetical protein
MEWKGDKTQLANPKHQEVTQTLTDFLLLFTLLEALTFSTVRKKIQDPTENIRPEPNIYCECNQF